jgi:mannose-6-phosphate isomerase-like protein (cupin superfamily)|tara:strand:- start:472 stop:858 length:387 start_codon:yes stop_codon:yes gene_type:complete
VDYDFLKNGSVAMVIDDQGRDHVIDVMSVDYYIAQQQYTVKVEGLEQHFMGNYPATVHCYISPINAASFAEHTDPVDVEIKCLEGTKTLVVNGKEIKLDPGESIIIPKHTPHRATNKFSSTMLSIGYK